MKRLLSVLFSALLLLCAVSCRTAAPAATAATAVPTASPTPVSTAAPTSTSVPTLTPTPSPTPTPATVTDAELDAGALDAFFDGALFVGDSMTYGLTVHVMDCRDNGNPDFMGAARFVSCYGYWLERAYLEETTGYTDALNYRGQFHSVSELVELIQPTRLFLMLGVDDINRHTADENILYMREVLAAIRRRNPDVPIVLQSATPVEKVYADRIGNCPPEWNEQINAAFAQLAKEAGIDYIDVAAHVRADDGYLVPLYCSDQKYHFNHAGKDLWLHLLRCYAREQYDKGLFVPPAA